MSRSFRPGQFSLVHSISKSTRMDPQTFMDVATIVTKLKMYPYFDIAHMILCCVAVRDDIVPQGEKIENVRSLFERYSYS